MENEKLNEIDKEIDELMQTKAPEKKKRFRLSLKKSGDQGDGLQRKKLSKRKKVIIAGVAVILLAGGIKMLIAPKNAIPPVNAALLEKKDIAETLSITGPVEGTDSVDVTSSLHARVSELFVKEGDRVEAGKTILLKIDTAELEKELDIARGNYELAVTNKEERLKELQRSYAAAKQEYDTAKADYDRKSALIQTGDISKVELESAANKFNDAKRNMSAFSFEEGKLVTEKSLDIQISNAKTEYERLVSRLQDATVVAPISGTVTRVNVKVGRFADDIENGRPMLTIENLDELRMKLNISEYSIGKISKGQKVMISADVLGEGNSVTGVITNVSPTGEEKGQGSTERVIPVTVSITDKDSKLMAGINAKAKIIINEARDTFVVPISAVGTLPDGKKVVQFLLTGEEDKTRAKVNTMEVKTGIESDIEVELLKNPLDAFDIGYEPVYLPVYNPMLRDGMELDVNISDLQAQ